MFQWAVHELSLQQDLIILKMEKRKGSEDMPCNSESRVKLFHRSLGLNLNSRRKYKFFNLVRKNRVAERSSNIPKTDSRKAKEDVTSYTPQSQGRKPWTGQTPLELPQDPLWFPSSLWWPDLGTLFSQRECRERGGRSLPETKIKKYCDIQSQRLSRCSSGPQLGNKLPL